MRITLKDNKRYYSVPWEKAVGDSDGSVPLCSDDVRKRLLHFDGVPLKKLRNQENGGGNFLVFPFDAGERDVDDDDSLFSLTEKDSDTPGFYTGNLMGFVGLGSGIQLQITSRFDSGKNNYFLHYMLQKVCNVALAPKTGSDEDQFYDFLYYLFPSYLHNALTQGMYHAYITREYNDANVRGPIDIARHIRNNIPFNGKIAYHTREYSTDNHVTQLVRHTIEFIRSLRMGDAVLNGGVSSSTRDDVRAIVGATSTYSRSCRLKVIEKNLRPITHPYYTAYEPLRKLCLAILRNQKLSYGDNSNDVISGIIFDGASLWEEYLGTLMSPDITHSNNRSKKDGISLFEKSNVHYYPDFYRVGDRSKTGTEPNGLVLDAKYKDLLKKEESEDFSDGKTSVSIGRDDLFQMMAYMYALPVNRAYLLIPKENKDNKLSDAIIKSKPKIVKGDVGEIGAIGFPIPSNAKTFEEFSERMKKVEESFLSLKCQK